MNDLLRLLTLQDENTRLVVLGSALLGLSAGVVGSFAVLRRRALVGDAVAHAALPGVCAAWLVFGERSLPLFLAGGLVFGLLAVVCLAFLRAQTRIKDDAAMAVVLGSFFGLGIVLSRVAQNRPSGALAGLDGFLFGKAASMVRQDVEMIALVSGASLVLVAVLFKEFQLVCFDRAFGGAQGWPVGWLDLGLMSVLVCCTVVGLPAVGVVLMAALLVIPAVTARFWTDRLGVMVVLAGVIGAVASATGAGLSAVLPPPPGSLSRGWPTGPMIVLSATAAFGVSMLAAPRRGIVAEWLRRRALVRRIAQQHLLRGVFECQEAGRDLGRAVSERELLSARSWGEGELAAAVRVAVGRDLVTREGDGLKLTPTGVEEASRVVRAHRLWALYLVDQAGIASDHVDRDADEIEHVLDAAVIRGLEERLLATGKLPASGRGLPVVGGEA